MAEVSDLKVALPDDLPILTLKATKVLLEILQEHDAKNTEGPAPCD